jgi:hypothetical protein
MAPMDNFVDAGHSCACCTVLPVHVGCNNFRLLAESRLTIILFSYLQVMEHVIPSYTLKRDRQCPLTCSSHPP